MAETNPEPKQEVVAGIEISPDELIELKDPIVEDPPTENSKWLSDTEEKAGKLFLSKVRHFSSTTGSTTTAQIGKSWPHANIQRGLVEQMKKWQELRHYKYRSDLLFHWATNLEEEEKLTIERTTAKSTSRFLIKPIANNASDEVPDNELESDFVFEGSGDSSMEEEKTPEKKVHPKKEQRQKKKRLSIDIETKNVKRFKPSREEGLAAISSYRNRLATDKDRYRQITQDMFNCIKESEMIVNFLWEQNQQAEQTIAELMRQTKELNARKEIDFRYICQLREENAALHEQLRKKVTLFCGLSASDDEADDVSDQSSSLIETKERPKDFKLMNGDHSFSKNIKMAKRRKPEGSEEEMMVEEVPGKEATNRFPLQRESPTKGIESFSPIEKDTPKPKPIRGKQKLTKETQQPVTGPN